MWIIDKYNKRATKNEMTMPKWTIKWFLGTFLVHGYIVTCRDYVLWVEGHIYPFAYSAQFRHLGDFFLSCYLHIWICYCWGFEKRTRLDAPYLFRAAEGRDTLKCLSTTFAKRWHNEKKIDFLISIDVLWIEFNLKKVSYCSDKSWFNL